MQNLLRNITPKETVRRGRELVAEIDARKVPGNSLAIWWLGQASFVVKGAGLTIYVDAFLSLNPDRLVPPAMAPDEVTNADVVLCSHDHDDHLDTGALPGIVQSSPRARVFVPGVARQKVIDLGVEPERVIVPPTDEPLQLGPLTLIAIPAAHEELSYTSEHGHEFLGFIVKLNGVTLYHSGDSVVYDGLIERLLTHEVDVALLPINGRDYFRLRSGCIGNMNYREAADLAAVARVDTVIPMHYDMFALNTEPPGNFVNYIRTVYPAQKHHVMARSEGFLYVRP